MRRPCPVFPIPNRNTRVTHTCALSSPPLPLPPVLPAVHLPPLPLPLSHLQYTSPFIGFDDMQWYVSGAMLTCNTFGAMMLTALALPLLAELHATLNLALQPCDDDGGNDGIHTTVSRGGDDGGGSEGIDDDPRVDSGGGPVAGRQRILLPMRPQDDGAGRQWLLLPRGPLGSTLPMSVAVYLSVRSLNACAAVLCAAVLRRNVVVWAIIAPKLVFELFFVAVSALALALGVVLAA